METRIDARPRPTGVAHERLALGLGLIGLGVLLTLDQLGLVALGGMRQLWPLILIAAGLGRLASPGRRGGAFTLLGLGLIFLLHSFRLARLHQTWPLFLVLGGISMLMRDRRERHAGDTGDERAGSRP